MQRTYRLPDAGTNSPQQGHLLAEGLLHHSHCFAIHNYAASPTSALAISTLNTKISFLLKNETKWIDWITEESVGFVIHLCWKTGREGDLSGIPVPPPDLNHAPLLCLWSQKSIIQK